MLSQAEIVTYCKAQVTPSGTAHFKAMLNALFSREMAAGKVDVKGHWWLKMKGGVINV